VVALAAIQSLGRDWMAGGIYLWALLRSWMLGTSFKLAIELQEPQDYELLTTGVASDSISTC